MCCWLVALVALVGCGIVPRQARKRVDTDLVQRIEFHGLGPPLARPVTVEQLRSQMGQKQSGWGARVPLFRRFVRAVGLDRDTLEDDAYRLETWLAHQGYFDARVEGWQVERKRPAQVSGRGRLRRAGVVVVHGYVTLGEPSAIGDFDVVWRDELADRFWRSTQARTITRTGWVIPGQTFSLASVEYTRDLLLAQILDHGHALGDVQIGIDAYPEVHRVDVTFDAETGPPTVIGEIRVEGQEDVTEEDILQVLDLEEGEPTRETDLAKAQQRLVSLGVFSLARVEPDTDALDEAQRKSSKPVAVPIKVDITEARFGTARAGFGMVYDGTTVTPRVSTSVRHLNIDGHLARFDAGANLGLGVPTVGGLAASRVLGGFEVGIARPRAFGPHWDTNAQLSFQRDLLQGQLIIARTKLLGGFAWRITDDVVLNLGPSIEFTRLGDGSPFATTEVSELSEGDRLLSAATFGTRVGEDVPNPFLLTVAEARLTIDWRKGDNVSLDPRGGYYYVAGLRQAVPLAGGKLGGYRFTDIYGEARFYRSVLSPNKRTVPATLALRLKGKWLPGPDNDSVDFRTRIPYPERAFLGGGGDMRGFRIGHVGAYDCICLVDEETHTQSNALGSVLGWAGLGERVTNPTERVEANPTYLPRGGRFSALVSGEVRLRDRSGRGVAVFGDAGVLGTTLDDLVNIRETLRWDLGLGYRQATPVGPIRFDLAFRPSFPEDAGPVRSGETAGTFQGEALGCEPVPTSRLPRRVPGLFVSDAFGGELPPVVVNFTIAIGEAI